ncbi:hypothetical protein GN956_G18539 [Arapaima gigas]
MVTSQLQDHSTEEKIMRKLQRYLPRFAAHVRDGGRRAPRFPHTLSRSGAELNGAVRVRIHFPRQQRALCGLAADPVSTWCSG